MSALSRRSLPALLSALLGACARPELPAGSVRMAPSVVLRLPGPEALGRRVEAAQLVRAHQGGQDFVFEAQLSVTPERLLLACVDMLGREALLLRWGQGRLAVQAAAWLPDAVRPENMLADIMLLFWPVESLRQGLGGLDVVLASGPRWRSLRVGDVEAIRAEYDSDTPWSGTVSYRNLAWDYGLDVQSIEVAS